MCVFCFVFLFHPCNLFLFGAKEKLCHLLAQARVPPSVLVPAVCAVDQNQQELCCQSSGFCQSPVTSLVFTSKQHSTERELCGQDSICVSRVGGGSGTGWWQEKCCLGCTSTAEISASDLWNRVSHFPPQGHAGTAPGAAVER